MHMRHECIDYNKHISGLIFIDDKAHQLRSGGMCFFAADGKTKGIKLPSMLLKGGGDGVYLND